MFFPAFGPVLVTHYGGGNRGFRSTNFHAVGADSIERSVLDIMRCKATVAVLLVQRHSRCSRLDKEICDDLAIWICNVDGHCDPLFSHRNRQWHTPYEASTSQRTDHAAFLLSFRRYIWP